MQVPKAKQAAAAALAALAAVAMVVAPAQADEVRMGRQLSTWQSDGSGSFRMGHRRTSSAALPQLGGLHTIENTFCAALMNFPQIQPQ